MDNNLKIKGQTKENLDLSSGVNVYNFQNTIRTVGDTFAEAIKPVIASHTSIQTTMSSYYSAISSILSSSILSSIDFERFQRELSEEQRKKIASCLKYDIYPPLLFLDEVILYTTFENQLDADEFLKEHLRYWKEEKNKSVYDFVPLSLRTYHEINQLKQLEILGMYKLMVIYCCERIEFILSELQVRQQKRNLAELDTSQKSFRNFLDTSNDDNEFLQNLIAKISYISEDHEKGYKEINLFKKFKDIEEMYKGGTLPLNRNLFLHGRVKESDVDYLMVQKAILAYAFFEQLFVFKSRKNKDIVFLNYKRKGISKVAKKFPRNMKRNK
ncbi:hypothetical protein [Streptococcus sobrinus]|uniref:hypothetical protein n=2 Tax=Streptococcus sobrinus TaxID=1310 RepID=UPI0002F5EEB2|nr:hypothetical protein [Streptococcus sobrinus]AWN19775.1 hypothetical protein DK181_10270 [Streptococcus sobrinus]